MCVYVYVYVEKCMCICIYLYVCACVCVCGYMYVLIFACMYVYVYVYVDMFVYVCVDVDVYMYAYTHVYEYTCIYKHICICIYISFSLTPTVKSTIEVFTQGTCPHSNQIYTYTNKYKPIHIISNTPWLRHPRPQKRIDTVQKVLCALDSFVKCTCPFFMATICLHIRCEWVTSHMNEPYHIWMSTYKWVVPTYECIIFTSV